MHVYRHDVNQWEHKHPHQIDEVPVQAANLDVFVFQLVNARCNNEEVNRSRRDVKHVQAGDSEKGCAKQRSGWRTVGQREDLDPVFRKKERSHTFIDEVSPLNQVEHDE